MSTKKTRLDLLLEEQGLFPSRQVARTAIMDGGVLVDGVKITKPGTLIKDGASIQVTKDWQVQKYVSRGGFKLEKALIEFNLDVKDKVCLDVGASTGGFTDCLLQAGAGLVYAVDVGYGQIAWSLRTDPRVKVIERVNARNLNKQTLQDHDHSSFTVPELAVIDVSFISLLKVLPAVMTCLSESALVVALVKPQFEAGRRKLVKVESCARRKYTKKYRSRSLPAQPESLFAQALTYSPLKGPQGNIEFLLLLSNSAAPRISADEIAAVVAAAAETLSS